MGLELALQGLKLKLDRQPTAMHLSPRTPDFGKLFWR
jgi:hypothetical protein